MDIKSKAVFENQGSLTVDAKSAHIEDMVIIENVAGNVSWNFDNDLTSFENHDDNKENITVNNQENDAIIADTTHDEIGIGNTKEAVDSTNVNVIIHEDFDNISTDVKDVYDQIDIVDNKIGIVDNFLKDADKNPEESMNEDITTPEDLSGGNLENYGTTDKDTVSADREKFKDGDNEIDDEPLEVNVDNDKSQDNNEEIDDETIELSDNDEDFIIILEKVEKFDPSKVQPKIENVSFSDDESISPTTNDFNIESDQTNDDLSKDASETCVTNDDQQSDLTSNNEVTTEVSELESSSSNTPEIGTSETMYQCPMKGCDVVMDIGEVTGIVGINHMVKIHGIIPQKMMKLGLRWKLMNEHSDR
eukprot:TRINITY_DN8128_c2_g1_i1.p1 TRINITY_DN8128_c2_g1~~TRINITY_DN8128_c2_g1_i1.p1  ORF type:complete len:369 (+),score=90.54 TRINITY_DN8128_c2_g1_i1:23-1108(+)